MSTLSHIPTPTSVFRALCATLLFLGLAATLACETSKKAERADAEKEPPEATLDTASIVQRAESARDRNLTSELTFERVEDAAALQASDDLPGRVSEDRSFLLEVLFGIETAPPDSPPGHSDLAVFDRDSDTIRYMIAESEAETQRAVFAAVVQAIDSEHFEELEDATTWDGYLARQTAKGSTTAFARVADAVADLDDVDPSLVARRPELVARIDGVDDIVAPTGEANRGSISALEREFTQRESWTLAAALYRANGWSGVELAGLMPPTRSADVVQPGNWLSGEPSARWTWPEDQARSADREGHVGAAVTAFWLSKTVSSTALRTLFAGWTSDRYRHWNATDARPARFEWLTLWDSPGSASQVTKAFELTLRERFPAEPDAHYVVFQKGLKVGVIISEEPPEQRRARAKEILEAKVQFAAREGLPVSFVPTRSDIVAERVAEATLEANTWSDPASGLEMDLSPLNEWKVDRPEGSAVRWFARGEHGALVQLTMEMHDPLGPEFGGAAYRNELRNAFTQTVEDANISGISNVELQFGRTLQATVDGTFEGTPTRIRFWHFKVDDLIFTYSFQAPSEAFGKYIDPASAIIQSTRREAAVRSEDREGERGKGIIEFEVEEN
jgi:hypothetical protein